MKAPIIAVVIVLVLAAALGAYYYSGGSLNLTSQPAQTQQNVPANTMTGLEIAKTIYAYIDTQRNSDGFYSYASNCDSNCPFSGSVFKNANTWPVYASVGMYRATNDTKYLGAAKRDADTMLKWCAQDGRECVRVLYQVDALNRDSGDQKYSDFLQQEAKTLMALPDQPETNFTMLISIDSVELADAYVQTGDKTMLDASVAKLNQAENLLSQEKVLFEQNGNKYQTFSCWPQIARLELFRATDDSKYLDSVKRFVADRNIPGNLNLFWMMTDLQPCMDVYQSLAELTGDSGYSAAAQKIAQHIITNYWDSSVGPKVSGNNAIKSNGDQKFSTITEASYMTYMLSRMKDTRFEVG